MLTRVNTDIATRLPLRRQAWTPMVAFVFGCAGDNLLLPGDGAPSELRIVSGDQQSAQAGTRVEHPLVVEALDGVGRPVRGVAVVFDFVDPPIGAEIGPGNTETDSAGRAAVQVKLGTTAGDQDVEARLDDPASDLGVRFRLTALQPNDGGGGEGGGGGGGGGGGDDDESPGGDGDGDGDLGGGGGGGGGGPPDEGGGGGNGGGAGDDGGNGNGSDGNKGKNDDNKGKGKGNDHGKGGKGKDKDKDEDDDD